MKETEETGGLFLTVFTNMSKCVCVSVCLSVCLSVSVCGLLVTGAHSSSGAQWEVTHTSNSLGIRNLMAPWESNHYRELD